MLGLAGIPKPSYMDGKSLVSLIVTESDHSLLPGSVAHSLSTAAPLPTRDASFVEYYNQGPWEVGKRHALDDWSNTYIGLNVRSPKWGSLKYGEYDPYGKQSGFGSVYFHELFNLTADPFELTNIYNDSAAELIRQPLQLAQELTQLLLPSGKLASTDELISKERRGTVNNYKPEAILGHHRRCLVQQLPLVLAVERSRVSHAV